jgi:hypothetical protein
LLEKNYLTTKPDSGQPEGGKSRLRAGTQWLGKRDEQTFWFMGKHYGVKDEGVNDIRNSFWIDTPGEKVCELLDKEFEPTISNNLISF